MYRRQLMVLVLGLCLLILPAAASGAPADGAGPPIAEEWCGMWCSQWSAAWTRLWSRWGPPTPGDALPAPPSTDMQDEDGVSSKTAATCVEPEPEGECERHPDWDPDG